MIRLMSLLLRTLYAVLDFLTPFVDFTVRCWIAKIFFMAGLTKIQSWDSTLMLFHYEYKVPLISPYLAAVLGTCGELVLPVLLVLGLGGRFCIVMLFFYNVMCAVSYPLLWTPQGATGLEEHINWGLLLALLMTHGSGKLSLDYWISKSYGRWAQKRIA